MNISEFTQLSLEILNTYKFELLVFSILLALILFLSRHKLKQYWLNRKTRRLFNKLGIKRIADFKCPDGLGYHFSIDRLILRHDGISLLLYKRFPGKIYCADDIDHWTQMIGRKSYRFDNPFYDLDCQIKAVSDCVPGIAVNGYLFFDHLAEFPKGRPDRVIQLKEIPEELIFDKGKKLEESVKAAWENLQAMSKK